MQKPLQKDFKRKIFKIPCEWSMFGVLEIKAKNIKEAIRLANIEAESCELPIGDYIDGSFSLNIDKDLIKLINA